MTALFSLETVSAETVSLEPLRRIENTCLSHDFSKVTCQATPAHGLEYQNADTFANRAQHVASRIFLRTLVWDYPPSGGLRLVDRVHTQLRNYANQKRLNTCQRIALATCAVNQILEYDESLDKEENWVDRVLLGLVHPNYFYYQADSRGICTEFCAVYAQLARAIGLRVQEMRNSLHCFNRVRGSSNEWLYVEPQEGGREPYYLLSNTFYLLDVKQ